MSDENKDQSNNKKTMLEQVMAEVNEARRKEKKTKLKALAEERLKAMAVLDGIDEKIGELGIGETPESIRAIFAE